MNYPTREDAQGWMREAIDKANAKVIANVRRQEAIRSELKKLNRQADQFARNLQDINRQREELMAEQLRLMKREIAA